MGIKFHKSDDIDVIKMNKPAEMQYSYSYSNNREKTKFIKRIEKQIRSSMEYRDYIAYLRENIGMDACAFYNNVGQETSKRIRIEVHHAPLTLYDIVNVVVNKYEEEGLPLNSLYIADEVMDIHYKNFVGLIPLSKTIHEVVHKSDKLIIPTYMIYGNYKKFIEDYSDYITDDIYEKIEDIIMKTKMLKKDSFDVLNKKFTYLEVDGFSIPAKIEDGKEVTVSDIIAA